MLKYLDWHCIGAFALYCIFTRKACCKVLPSPSGREGEEILRVEWESHAKWVILSSIKWRRTQRGRGQHPPVCPSSLISVISLSVYQALMCFPVSWHHNFVTRESTHSCPDKTRCAWSRFRITRHDELRYLAVWSFSINKKLRSLKTNNLVIA